MTAIEYIVGVDIGGTFTDCVVTDDAGHITIGKASSTPPDFHRGFVDSIAAAGRRLDLSAAEVVSRAKSIVHGCTVGTNALVEKRTAKVALLTTAGHRDTIFFMQAGNRLAGLDAREIAHLAGQSKPEPLVPKSLVLEVEERIAKDGSIIVRLDEKAARQTIKLLVDQGVEAFAIALLWSTSNDSHERILADIVREEAPGAFASVSSEVVPRIGEYQRSIATVINAMIGPVTSAYLGALGGELSTLGYTGSLAIMSCTGGLIEADRARTLPLLTVGSGPVAGLIGAGKLARAVAADAEHDSINVLTGDMGGTTFDVGVIRGGEPVSRSTTRYGQFEYFVPTLDVRSVGAGGGSIVGYDDQTRSLRVGPRSAGAVPGPACYLRGGTQATVTDADLVLGYLNPEYFLGGELGLGADAAREALERAGQPLGFTAEQTAAAAVRIVDDQMADAIRLASVHQGYDPRGCVMYAYGGAGGAHCPAVARQLGIRTVVMPLGDLAAGWSAFGVGAADALLVQDAPTTFAAPFDPGLLNAAWKQVEEQVWAAVPQAMRDAGVTLDRYVEMRYTLQVNELRVPAPGGQWGPAEIAAVTKTFEDEYERLFGPGAGYAAAGYVITSLRVSARAHTTNYELSATGQGEVHDLVPTAHRDVIWYEFGTDPISTPIFSGADLGTGARITGPAVVEFVDTTLVLRQGQVATVDAWASLVIEA